jgi:hypothetical protein
VVVKLRTVQVTKLPLYEHNTLKIGTISFAKPGLRDDFCVVQNEELSITAFLKLF